jgi:hypothetical protein
MRTEDLEPSRDAPFAVEPHQFGGSRGVHYPDVMLLVPSGRVAIKLLLSAPPVEQLEAVLRAYAADVRMQAVLYLVVDPRLGGPVESAAAGLELSAMVHVQLARFGWRPAVAGP